MSDEEKKEQSTEVATTTKTTLQEVKEHDEVKRPYKPVQYIPNKERSAESKQVK